MAVDCSSRPAGKFRFWMQSASIVYASRRCSNRQSGGAAVCAYRARQSG